MKALGLSLFLCVTMVFALSMSVVMTGCSTNETLKTINTVGLGKILLNEDKQVVSKYMQYKPLLNESEEIKAEYAYRTVKNALENTDLESLLKYEQAKTAYRSIIPIYEKYEAQISEIDKPFIKGIHNKLTAIISAIDEAKSKAVTDALTIEYLRTLTILASAFI